VDIDIDPANLTARTRNLLLDFQRIQLRHAMNQATGLQEDEITGRYVDIKRAFQKCPERRIADIGARFDFEKVCERLDEICTALVESGSLKEDDYQEEFDRRLSQHCKEVEELESALVRLSLRVADVRPPFFKQLN
jgi:hypothetical protein